MRTGFLCCTTAITFAVIFSGKVIAEDLEVKLIAPFQNTVEENGVTTTTPLLVMPCKGATKPQHPGEGDLFIVLKNISKRSLNISMREATPVNLNFSTPTGTVVANKWLPKEYAVHYSLPKCPGLIQYIYTLKPGEIHIYPINLFLAPKLVNQPLDWMAVCGTNKMKIECTVQYDDDNSRHILQSGWIPIAVREPEPDPHDTVPEGSAVEAVPSPHPGEPPVYVIHPKGFFP
jgi:hypothetical protein